MFLDKMAFNIYIVFSISGIAQSFVGMTVQRKKEWFSWVLQKFRLLKPYLITFGVPIIFTTRGTDPTTSGSNNSAPKLRFSWVMSISWRKRPCTAVARKQSNHFALLGKTLGKDMKGLIWWLTLKAVSFKCTLQMGVDYKISLDFV